MTLDAALAPLARAIRAMGTQFSLHLVRCPRSARTALTAALLRLRAEPGVPLFAFNEEGRRGAQFVDRLLEGDRHVDGVVLLDGDGLLDHDGASLRALNLARDRLASFCHGPLVIVLTEDAVDELARQAPDLYSVRSTVTTFEREQFLPVEPALSAPPRDVLSLRALLDQLAEREMHASPEVVADMLIEIAEHAQRRLAKANDEERPLLLASAREALDRSVAISEHANYERAAIDASLLRTELFPSAVAALDEQLVRAAIARLAVLGATRSEALAWWRLSRMLRARDPAEALEALESHALPLLAEAGAFQAWAHVVTVEVLWMQRERGADAAHVFLEHAWASHGASVPISNQSMLLGLRSSLAQLVGKLDRAIEYAQAAREAAVATRNAELTRAALLREIVARAGRRANVDRAVVAQLLPQFRGFAGAPANIAVEDNVLNSALVRLGLREESPRVAHRGPLPRNRAERRRQRRSS